MPAEMITAEQERLNECEASAARVKEIIDDIEDRDFRADQFDDRLVRERIERVTAADKHTTRVKILKAGGVEIPV